MPTSSKQSAQPGEDGLRLRPGQEAQADEEAAVVIDEPDDPDLRVLAPGALQEEGPLDVDVPELVGPTALVGRAVLPADRGARRAQLGEEGVHGMVAERVDVPSRELRGEALAVPVGQEAHGDDGALDPGRQTHPGRSSWSLAQGLDAARLVAAPPAEQARPADAESEGRGDALGDRRAHAADAEAQATDILAHARSGRSSPARGEEEEAGSLLVRVPTQPAMGIGRRALVRAVHPATLASSSGGCSTNPGNYT